MLPFVNHYFPDAAIVPVAISIRADRADWDRMAEALAPLVDADTLIVESTDFSHYLPQHEARRFDQQTLNILASGSLDGIAALLQPQHADSVGALYIQTKLQKAAVLGRAAGHRQRELQRYSTDYVAETTSYMVILFGRFGPPSTIRRSAKERIYYFAGDTIFGRSMNKVLLDEEAAERIAGEILAPHQVAAADRQSRRRHPAQRARGDRRHDARPCRRSWRSTG